MPLEITGRLEDWEIVNYTKKCKIVVGLIFEDNRGRFKDGKLICTSCIKKGKLKEGEVIKTLNSNYKLGVRGEK